MNLENNILTDGNCSLKIIIYCMILFIWNIQKRKISRNGKSIGGCQGLRRRKDRKGMIMNIVFLLERTKNILKLEQLTIWKLHSTITVGVGDQSLINQVCAALQKLKESVWKDREQLCDKLFSLPSSLSPSPESPPLLSLSSSLRWQELGDTS